MRNLIAQLRTDIQPFAVHAMLVQRFHPHRLKRAGADMQGDMAELHTTLAQRRQQRLGEMQPSGRRRYRAGLACKHSLVAITVVAPALTGNEIRRAKCRESVGQYVMASVGAVELKKKH